ncbi:hypothetical protein OB934_20630 [Aeromonas salmonicida]|uniref:hypothetical protein n=1 Tax=Aeromonas salmonicida TaxID=645 RepID=UPI001F1C36A9|nr:hypothetical protein [Aeromonas salmonicida]MCE9935619.1 hypothetical protein [Aeromonas salmonicida]MDM5065182.1 hypothetical protein [Aeromonas salmonicida]
MYHAFDLFSIITLVLIIAVIGIVLFQLNRPETIVLSSPSWLIALMSPATVLPLVPILFVLWTVGTSYLYGATAGNIFGLIFSGFCCYTFKSILHKGARVLISKPVRELQWWIDYRGNLHPHFIIMNSADRTNFSKRREKALSLLADIQEVGPFGRPIVVKTPFKLDYLSARLVREGWKIERSPATRCPWIVKVALSMRRRTLQIPLLSNGWRIWRNWRSWRLPTRHEWQELAQMHHAVLFPPGYLGVKDNQVAITPPAASLLKD